MNSVNSASFGIVDFVVFTGSLVLSMGIGVYYAIVDRNEKSVQNYYFAESKMALLPVALSISVSFISAMTFIAIPTEAYLYGSVGIWFAFGSIAPSIVACLYYIPLICRLQLTSIFEYLELRFHGNIRKTASVFTFLTMMIYMSITIYLPALALSAVTPLGLNWTITLTTLICTFYTTMGGMKAVIWADTLQTVVMVAGSLATFIKCVSIVGGFENAYNALERGNRLNFFTLGLDPTLRNSFFSIIVGGSFGWCPATCISQPSCQRYLSCKSVKQARMAAMLAVIPNFFFMLIAVLTGCVMYAYFEGCDPIMNKEIQKPDQILPYMVVQIFQDMPGMAGLFVSAVFCGTLSTVSSGINALAALLLKDFVLALRPSLNSVTQLTISKITVLFFGLLLMGLASSIQYIPGTVIQIMHSFGSCLVSPILGVYTLGMFCPWATSKGTMIGQFFGTALTAWIVIGGLFFSDSLVQNRVLPASVDECFINETVFNTSFPETTTSFNSTLYYSTAKQNEVVEGPSLNNTLYAVTYLYYSAVATLTTVVVGLLASFLTGAQNPKVMDPKLFVPIIDNQRLPEKVVKFFRFGVSDYINEKDKSNIGEDDFLMYKSTNKEEKFVVDSAITSI